MAAEPERGVEPDKIASGCSTTSNLPDVVASMEMLSVDSEMSSSSSSSSNNTQEPRYGMRKRVPKVPAKGASSEVLNRRCSLKPRKKRCFSAMENEDDIQEYYLDKNIKKMPNTKLETILEEFNGISDNSTVIRARSFKRLIQFNSDKRTIDAKIKRRKAKIKRVFGSKIKLKFGTVTMQELVQKLNGIRSEARSATDT